MGGLARPWTAVGRRRRERERESVRRERRPRPRSPRTPRAAARFDSDPLFPWPAHGEDRLGTHISFHQDAFRHTGSSLGGKEAACKPHRRPTRRAHKRGQHWRRRGFSSGRAFCKKVLSAPRPPHPHLAAHHVVAQGGAVAHQVQLALCVRAGDQVAQLPVCDGGGAGQRQVVRDKGRRRRAARPG